MSRSAAKDPGIIRAQLDGHARWLLRNTVDPERCLAELHEITTDRVLLGQASGNALGAWEATKSHDSDRVVPDARRRRRRPRHPRPDRGGDGAAAPS